MRSTTLVPSTASKAMVCVNGVENHEMTGTIYNSSLPEPAKFRSVTEIIFIMESIFSKLSFPQPYYEDRSFTPKLKDYQKKPEETEVQKYMPEDILFNEQGKKATFMIQVQSRQNSTWQGTITWTDEKKAQRFRSTLEMIKLMDGALGDSSIEWK